ncbi:1,4-dihydroxy-2-naphthoate polyprenyltransferase [Alloiococcus sp. CFN-8]|uniref:1,4-dihydroxy-2-naphthoate polyprenyltransferase n=1 Tax=Alloiococcus sp. CFN-8 TaxID=3416081 RepID=UPI003CEBC52E
MIKITVKSFLKLVELPTKVASVFPFLLGTIYAIYTYERFNFINFIFMFLSLISIDMVTTAINNYMDYKKAIITKGFNYEEHNAIVAFGLKESTVLITIFTLLASGIIFGVLLFLNTNIVILLLGAVSFGIGILYSFGPVPISRTPLGELASGLTMGLIITFLAAYIHVFQGDLFSLSLSGTSLLVTMNLTGIISLLFVALPAVAGIANIMLANNLCDMEDDRENRRYTLPIYIGRERGLLLFKWLYYISYIVIIILILLGIEPVTAILVLLTFIPVNKNIKSFFELQTKKDTFILAVKNFILISLAHVIALALGALLKVML